jgi:hypothetical protein
MALLILAASSPACGSAHDEPMAITGVIGNIDALNGRTVRVAGYLGECGGYECRLFRNASERTQVDSYYRELMAAAQAGRRPSAIANELPWLGIGSGENREFERLAAPFQNGYVVITGRVTNRCRYNGQPACTGRSTDIEPTEIARWSPPQSDAGNGTQ